MIRVRTPSSARLGVWTGGLALVFLLGRGDLAAWGAEPNRLLSHEADYAGSTSLDGAVERPARATLRVWVDCRDRRFTWVTRLGPGEEAGSGLGVRTWEALDGRMVLSLTGGKGGLAGDVPWPRVEARRLAPPEGEPVEAAPMVLRRREIFRNETAGPGDERTAPAGTLLASELLREGRDLARRGRRSTSALVLDPSLGLEPVLFTTLEVLERFEAPPPMPRVEADMTHGSGARLRLTYYAPETLDVPVAAEAEPRFPALAERDLTVLDNGLITAFRERRGERSWDLKLIAVHRVNDEACAPQRPKDVLDRQDLR
jgi:hypothetical protein